jgi:hypothetical protein
MMLPTAPLRAASVLFFIDGVGFGVFAAPAIIRVFQHRPVPIVFGFPAYGGGPFERIGLKSTVPLLAAFLLVNVLEVVAGVLVWRGIRSGAILGFALVPFGAFFWWGFALPIPPLLAVARSVLVLFGWKHLH